MIEQRVQASLVTMSADGPFGVTTRFEISDDAFCMSGGTRRVPSDPLPQTDPRRARRIINRVNNRVEAANKVYRDARVEEQERADRVNKIREECLIEVPLIIANSGGFFDPDDCLEQDIFRPSGGDAQGAAVVDLSHILSHPTDAYLN